jgi:tRNA U34 5-carboxymethylaminomethyl modifying GTPase MnmE/TrmE
MDTIFALASAVGKAGVAVVRLSGAEALAAAEVLCGGGVAERGMRLRSLRDGDGAVLDQALVLSFRGPASFTGEDVVEFQLHGSPAIVSAVLDRLGGCQACAWPSPENSRAARWKTGGWTSRRSKAWQICWTPRPRRNAARRNVFLVGLLARS